jgi:hypothetical protein
MGVKSYIRFIENYMTLLVRHVDQAQDKLIYLKDLSLCGHI